jgi:serine/threonine protein kinase
MAGPEVGAQWGSFLLEAEVGRGGVGVVYRAWQRGLDREVALKVIAQELAGDPEFRERFRREARLAASVEHPNVLPVYEAGSADQVLYVAMRFVEGADLRALLRAERWPSGCPQTSS